MLQLGSASTDENPHFFATAKQSFKIQPEEVEATLDQELEPTEIAPFILVRPARNDQAAKWIRVTFQDLGSSHSGHYFLRLEDISERIVSFQEKHTFSRMITHKLLTPLNAIKAAHQLLESSDGNPERLSHVRKIQKKGIERLEYDIHSILSFLETERSHHNVLTVAEAYSHLAQLAERSPFDFKVSIEEEIAPSHCLQISAQAFDACLREIVENAIKFHRGDSVSINCYIRSPHDSQEIQILFQNNSYPLSEDEIENAWKPYWQADRYVTGEIPGMGLGLSLIAANIWTAGGACKIENHPPSDGVQLTLSFPLHPQLTLA